MVWRVRLLLAQLNKTPHGCLEHQVSMRGFFVSAFRRIKKGPSLWGESPFGLPWKLAADQSSSSAPVYSW